MSALHSRKYWPKTQEYLQIINGLGRFWHFHSAKWEGNWYRPTTVWFFSVQYLNHNNLRPLVQTKLNWMCQSHPFQKGWGRFLQIHKMSIKGFYRPVKILYLLWDLPFNMNWYISFESTPEKKKQNYEFLLSLSNELPNISRMLREITQVVIVLGLFPSFATENKTLIATSQVIIYESINHGGNRQFQPVHTISCMSN